MGTFSLGSKSGVGLQGTVPVRRLATRRVRVNHRRTGDYHEWLLCST
ncbi:hypothetical protein [Oryzomonas rubra]|nr:hypothetical protein [Oryzomonas rubra]